jgi:hypothetical protein
MTVILHPFRTYYFEDADYARAFAAFWNAQLLDH